jgi:hypothetical protein
MNKFEIFITYNGVEKYLKNGKLHNDSGPACIYPINYQHTPNKRTLEWYKYGLLHREDGPAIEKADGTKEWYLNGKLNRKNGAAIEYPNGVRTWYTNGKLNRRDGPAIEYPSGVGCWYINDKRLTETQFNYYIRKRTQKFKFDRIEYLSIQTGFFNKERIYNVFCIYNPQMYEIIRCGASLLIFGILD